MIAVGDSASLGAWRALQRPVDWAALVQMLDELFASSQEIDIDIFAEAPPASPYTAGYPLCLVRRHSAALGVLLAHALGLGRPVGWLTR